MAKGEAEQNEGITLLIQNYLEMSEIEREKLKEISCHLLKIYNIANEDTFKESKPVSAKVAVIGLVDTGF